MSGLVPGQGILDISPYVGGESRIEGAGRIIKLSSNESALGPSPHVQAAYKAEAGTLHRYPDGGVDALRAALGRHHGLDPDRIVCGNGSDELFSLLARAYAGPGEEVLYSRHGFLMYKIVAQAVGATPIDAPETQCTADVDALLAAAGPATRILFLANPNNPTGTYVPTVELRRLREGLPGKVLLVIDGAYAEYVDERDYTPGSDLVEAYDNVVMTRTFSKIYALPALRLGWAYCPAAIADVLNRVRMPFNVGGPARAAGIAALADVERLAAAKALNDEWRPWLARELAGLGLEVVPSVANFVLARFESEDRARVVANDLKARGILVRRVKPYGFPEALRITVGLAEENRAVIDALAEILG